jgi:hypothetical protein
MNQTHVSDAEDTQSILLWNSESHDDIPFSLWNHVQQIQGMHQEHRVVWKDHDMYDGCPNLKASFHSQIPLEGLEKDITLPLPLPPPAQINQSVFNVHTKSH